MKAPHEKMRAELLTRFMLSEEDTKKCFGCQPEGGESAYFKGCLECPDQNKCADATDVVEATIPASYYKKSNERYSVKKDNRGPYVHDASTGYSDSMSPAEIVRLLNKYEEMKK